MLSGLAPAPDHRGGARRRDPRRRGDDGDDDRRQAGAGRAADPRGEYEAALSTAWRTATRPVVARDDAAARPGAGPGPDQDRRVWSPAGRVRRDAARRSLAAAGGRRAAARCWSGCCWCSPSRCWSPSSSSPAAGCAPEPTGEIPWVGRGGHPRTSVAGRPAGAAHGARSARGRASWASILEDEHPRAGESPRPRCRSSTRTWRSCPTPTSGKGATVGSVIPTLRRDHPRRRRRRHRLRHDRGPDAVHARRTSPVATGAPLRRADRAGGAAVGGRVQHARSSRPRPRRGSPSSRTRRRGRLRPGRATPANWRLQLGTLGSRQPLHRGHASTRTDRVWLFLHSGRRGVGNKIAQHHIKVAQRAVRSSGGSTLPDPRPRLPGRGHATSSGRTSASCGGRSTSRCSTARR